MRNDNVPLLNADQAIDAAKGFFLATAQGNSGAQTQLAMVLFDHEEEIRPDSIYQTIMLRIVTPSYLIAQSTLGRLYYEGNSAKHDINKALKWYTMAAENGHYFSQCALGIMYSQGQGVEQNQSIATKWILKSGNRELARCSLPYRSFDENGIIPKDQLSIWLALNRFLINDGTTF